MPLLPVPHFGWQVLRTVKRSRKPPPGRALRLIPTRRTKDGTFLTDLVELELLTRVTGTVAAPFEATYALTERGEDAAEYGECDMPLKAKVAAPPAPRQPQRPKNGKGIGGAGS